MTARAGAPVRGPAFRAAGPALALAWALLAGSAAAADIERAGMEAFRDACLGERPAGAERVGLNFDDALERFEALGFQRRADGFRYHPEFDIIGDAETAEGRAFCIVSVRGGARETMRKMLAEHTDRTWERVRVGDWIGVLKPGPDPRLFVTVVDVESTESVFAYFAALAQAVP